MKIEKKPDSVLSIGDLKRIRKKVFKRKASKEQYMKAVPVWFKDSKPIGILHFGDMHLDSDGTNLDLIDAHIDLLKNTEGLYGGNLGDSTNNWVGFLGRLHGEQHTTIEEAEKLLQHYLGGTDWLYTIVGNHDKWNGGEAVIHHIVDSGVIGEDIRLILKFPNQPDVTLHARHNFTGNSMYNPAHGAVKEGLFGSRDDIIVHGHKHSTGYSIMPDAENSKLMHCISVGSYKEIDSYKITAGFRDDNISPACVTVINPKLPSFHPDRVKVFFDPFVGAKYLEFIRNK